MIFSLLLKSEILDKARNNIVFFDGICALCNSTVDYIIQKDKNSIFLFAPLQGKTASKMIPEKATSLASLVYFRHGEVLEKSTAAIRIFSDLGGLRKLYLAFIIIPKFLRDVIYSLIAKNRYKWFGTRDHCRIPEVWIMNRFLE